MDHIRSNHIYTKALEELIGAEKDPTLKTLIQSKVEHIGIESISMGPLGGDEIEQQTSLEVRLGGVSEDVEHQAVVLVCRVFNFAVKEVKELETKMFHIDPPPPPSLVPVDGPVTDKYTMIQHSVREPQDVINIAKAFNIKSIRTLISVRPERAAMHHICRRFFLNHCIQGETSEILKAVIPKAKEEFLAANPGFAERVAMHRQEIESRALAYLAAKKEGGTTDFEYGASVDKLFTQIAKEHGLSSDELDLAIAQRMADLVVNEYVKDAVERTDINAIPSMAVFPPLPPQKIEDRRTFMVAGGIASGKGTTEKVMIETAKSEGVDWSHVLCWNNDALKEMLLDPSELGDDAIYFSALTYNESYVIRDKVFEDYRKRIEDDTAPHLYIDQTLPREEIFDLAASPKGRGLDLTVVQMPAESSFQLAYYSGEKTKRFETTSGIINTHAGVPKQLLQSLEYAKREGLSNVRVNIVKNVKVGVVEPLVTLDLFNGTGQITDLDSCREFFKKITLNPDARKFEELYPGEPVPPEMFDAQIGRLASFVGTSVPVFNNGIQVGVMGGPA